MEDERTEPEPRPVTFLAAAGWTLLLRILFEVSLTLIDAVHPGALTDLVTFTGAQVLAVSVVLFVFLRVHEPESSVRSVLALRPPSVLVVLLAIVVGAAMAIPVSWFGSLLTERLPTQPQEKELLERLFSVATPGKRAVVIASLVVVMPLCHELFFHGALFTGLLRQRRADVVVLATAAYGALVNFSPRGLIALLFVLVALGWIRSASGSAIPSVAARMAFSAVLFLPDALGRPGVPTTKQWLAGAAVAGLLALSGIRVLTRRSRTPTPTPTEEG